VPVLICHKCQIYYEINSKEELDDFSHCNCGEELAYYESIEEYLKIHPESPQVHDESGKENNEKSTPKKPKISKKAIVFASFSFFILIVALIATLLISAGAFNSTHHYPGPWCSFDYPNDWKISTSENIGLNTPQAGLVVISLWDPTDKKHLTSFIYTRYIKELAEVGLAHEYNLYQEVKPANAKISSNKTIIIEGNPFYELQFSEETTYGTVKGSIILDYGGEEAIVYKAPAERYPDINNKFNIILNSFSHIQG
jgi:hypothetical protein